MFSIFSWKRRGTELLAAVVCAALTHMAAAAETVTVRLGPTFRDAEGVPLSDRETLPRVMSGLEDLLPFVLFDGQTCADLLVIPWGKMRGRDTLRETWVIITSLRVKCWVLSQATPEARVIAADPTDRITPQIISAIMGYLRQMSMTNEVWKRTFMSFRGGEITCANPWRCTLELPDGRNPPGQSLDFKLLMAAGSERFIAVTQIVSGRSGFVYGVRLSGIEDDSPEVSVYFFDLE